MTRNRSRAWKLVLAFGLAIVAGNTAFGQSYRVDDLQLFRPLDLSTYEDQPRSPVGFYGSAQYLNWIITKPASAPIGAPITRTVFNFSPGDPANGVDPTGGGVALTSNSITNHEFDNVHHSGERLEFGYMGESGVGWGFSSFMLHNKTQRMVASNVNMLFNDPQNLVTGFVDFTGPAGIPDGFDDDINGNGVFGRDGIDTDVPPDGIPNGPPPVDLNDIVTFPLAFRELTVLMKTYTYSASLQRTWRTAGGQFGGWLDWGIGGRYVNFNDSVVIDGYIGILDTTNINQRTTNSIVAPEFSLRWANQSFRFVYSGEMRLAPGINFQSVRHTSNVGSNIIVGAPNQPLGLAPTGTNARAHMTAFSPIVDARVNIGYKLTEKISVNVGGSLIYLGGIARSINMIDYSLPNTGINIGGNTQPVFMSGINAGVEINR